MTELWSAAARPTATAQEPPGPPHALLTEIGAARTEPLPHGGNSGASLLRAVREDGSGFVLKRVTPGADWLARATRDEGRTARLHAAGAFEAMPRAIDHAVVGVARDRNGAWVAMRDVGPQLLAADARMSRGQSRQVLGAAAALHAAFRGRVPDGAASLTDRLGMSSPAVAAAERTANDLLPKQFEHGWEGLRRSCRATSQTRSWRLWQNRPRWRMRSSPPAAQ